MSTEEILTAREVAGLLKVSRRTVYDLLSRGELRARFKLFGKTREGWRWTRSDVNAYLERCRVSINIDRLLRTEDAPPYRSVELPR